MRKLKLFLSMLMLIAFSVGNVWAADYFVKVTTEPTSWEGDYLIVYEGDADHDAVAFNGGLSSLDANDNKIAVTISDGKIAADATINAAKFTIASMTGGYSIRSASGKYIGATAYSNSLVAGDTPIANNLSISDENAVLGVTIGTSGTVTLRYNYAKNTWRFRYYKSGQQAISLYKFEAGEEESGDDVIVKTLKSIALSGQTTSFYQNAAFAFDGTCTATYSVTKNDVAQADEQKVVTPTSVSSPDMTTLGNKEVTVTFTDGEVSKEAKYTITVTEAPAAVNYELVTNANDLADAAEIIIVNIDEDKAISTTQASSNRTATAVSSTSHVIAAGDDVQVIILEASSSNWKLSVGEDSYLYASSNSSNQLKTAKATTAGDNGVWAITIANDGAATIVAQGTNGRNNMRYNPNNGSAMFSCYASTSTLGLVKIFKKVEGAVKPAAGLAYAEADQRKLTKLGDAFTAPTLVNPNNLTVAYTSNNTDVAEVNASTGAVTIKAAGVAVITASFDGNDDYKAGSASYTIGVTTHAGTEADPYVAADAKIAIDAMGTVEVENAYATGIVSNVVTKTLPQEGYITFYFSADGATTGQQIEAYKCYGLNSAAFEALSDVETGATVVVTGNLKKYNSTYEFDANCHLVSYEAPAVPKTHIANDQANPYTVAQAIAYAADGVTYDLDDYVYVQGVVYDVKSFNNGAMNIFIKDANAENQFELYKCAGINDGNATTPFEALTDVQAGNIVIGYGQLTVYNTTYEFKQGNYLVDIQKPATGIELDATAEVEAGSTVNLTATILPSNATGTIVWSVESGDTYASVDGGVVTGIAEGEAVIRATVQGTAFYAECTVTVTPEAAPVSYDYALVTDAAQLQDGLKVIIVAAEEDKAAGSAAATYRNVVNVERTTDGNYLILDSENMPTEFTLGVSGENFTLNDGNGYMYESAAKSVKVQDEAFEWTISIGDGNIATIQATNELRYNSTSPRFTTYASGQQALQLYVKNDGKQAAGLAWSANAVELTVGDEFTAPTLTNPNNLVVTITSDNEEVATVSEGIVSLVADATGIAKITASYAGDETYRAASVSYTITVNPAPVPAETKNIVILAEYNSKFYAMTNSLSSGALAAVEVEKDGSNIVVSSAEDKAAIQWTATVEGENTTLMDANNKYIKGSNGASLSLDDAAYIWNWDGEKSCYISSEYTTRGLFFNNSGVFKGYATSNLANDAYAATEVIEIAAENIILSTKVDPQLAFNPEEVTLTVGDEFVAPVLGYVEGFNALADVTLESSNTSLAVVNEGVVSLVEDAIGTATITATFAGNSNYLAGSASYTITVNEAGDDLSGSWVLATAVPAVGQKVIIAATYQNETKAMGIQNSNNRAAVASTLEDDVLTPGAGTKVFTLVDAGDGKFAIQASNGNYLSAAGTGTSNFLKEAENFDEDNAKWTITIENGEANIVASSNNRNVLRYNSGNTIFSCYQSGAQRAINIYVQDTYTRALEPNHYYTVCLPKKMMEVRGASFWTLSSRNEAGSMAYLEEVDPTIAEAGTPFIIQATDTKLEVVYTGTATTTAGTNGALRGTLNGIDAEAFAALPGNPYLLINNAIRPRTTGNFLAANRAYIEYSALEVNTPQPAPGRRVRAVPMQQNTATGIDELNGSEAPAKVLINGQLFILRGEKMYDVKGQLVK